MCVHMSFITNTQENKMENYPPSLELAFGIASNKC